MNSRDAILRKAKEEANAILQEAKELQMRQSANFNKYRQGKPSIQEMEKQRVPISGKNGCQ